MLTRRQILKTLAASGLCVPAAASARRLMPDPSRRGAGPFQHGVASGDPLPQRVILWTRVTPDNTAASIDVQWLIATDPELTNVVNSGQFATDAGRDYTVKVDAAGLAPGTTYYYRFDALGSVSPTGRTRTLPVGALDRLRLAFCSCSSYPHGFYNAYRAMAQRADLDVVVHLGDYIYEYANGTFGDGSAIGRIPEPDAEILTLADYRTRHAQYKADPDLQELHRQHPMIAVWDDHESANNAWTGGAENHNRGEGFWGIRRTLAIKVYREWMPIREARGFRRIYRFFRFGDLADLAMLDTRLFGRDEQPASAGDTDTINDPARQLLGAQQEQWLFNRLLQSKADNVLWRLLGQQVMFAPLTLNEGTTVLNVDQWDGYRAARDRVFAFLQDNGVDNLAVLTGDIHTSWANELPVDPYDPAQYDPVTGAGSLGVEFVAPGITSAGIEDPGQAALLAILARAANPHMKYAELNRRGYVLLDVDRSRAQAEWYYPDTILAPSGIEEFGAGFRTDLGSSFLQPVAFPSTPPAAPPPAP